MFPAQWWGRDTAIQYTLYNRGSRFISNLHSCFWKCYTVEAVDLFQICTVAFGNAKANLFPVFAVLFPTISSEFWLLKSIKHLL